MAEDVMVVQHGTAYQARILVKTGALIGPDTGEVESKLTSAGFEAVHVWDSEGSLPSDWPDDRRSDVSEGDWDQVWAEGVWMGASEQAPASGSGWKVYDVWRKPTAQPIEISGQSKSRCNDRNWAQVSTDGHFEFFFDSKSAGVISSPVKDNTVSWKDVISYKASEFGLPEALVGAIVSAESGGEADAKSSAGALGLMQLMPGTARWASDPRFPHSTAGLKDPPQELVLDPTWNVHHGCKVLRYILDRYEGNVVEALASYNHGKAECGTASGCPENPWKLIVGCYKPNGTDYVTAILARANALIDDGWNGVAVAPPTAPPKGEDYVKFGKPESSWSMTAIEVGLLLLVPLGVYAGYEYVHPSRARR